MSIEKVCVRIPAEKKDELLLLAKQWREERRPSDEQRSPGWDRIAVHKIANDHYGSLLKMFEKHGWRERGSAMPRQVMSKVKEAYGSIEQFVLKHP